MHTSDSLDKPTSHFIICIGKRIIKSNSTGMLARTKGSRKVMDWPETHRALFENCEISRLT